MAGGNVLSVSTSVDADGRHIVGPNNYLPAGTRVGSTDYAIAHATLLDQSGNALLYAVDMDTGVGVAYRMGMALLVAASGGPAVVTGDATSGLDVDVTRLPYTSALTPTHTAVTAISTSGGLLTSNANRKYAFLQNIGSVDVFIKLASSAAVANQGICLKANGGFHEIGIAFGNLYTGTITCITASGSAVVLVTEEV